MNSMRNLDWTVVAGMVWMLLVATAIFLAVCRVAASAHDRKLIRLGVSSASPLHIHLQR